MEQRGWQQGFRKRILRAMKPTPGRMQVPVGMVISSFDAQLGPLYDAEVVKVLTPPPEHLTSYPLAHQQQRTKARERTERTLQPKHLTSSGNSR
ncbi:hypothetical protein BDN72DRAFT_907326 [Pluteus cervinus]|uniref:Uncharacterized protein n=1 Tax=Pluteus cervinus TaxID=181527 RepID=A0ACD2ZXL9_9AGAR|nr:hypothetical protein BDN72DRAFT_907326 [Pluteus cervinus]